MTIKPTNPKDLVGIKKIPQSCVSQAVMREVGVALMEGDLKYGRHNYREAGVRASIYYDATRRHIDDWWEGESIDTDSGLHNVTKAIAALTVLRDAMIQGKYTDDRPPPTPPEHKKYMQGLVDDLLVRLPERKYPPVVALEPGRVSKDCYVGLIAFAKAFERPAPPVEELRTIPEATEDDYPL